MPDPTVPRVVAVTERFRRELLAQERAAATRMVRAYGAAWGRLTPRLDALTAQIEAAHTSGKEVHPDWLRRQQRYQELLEQMAAELQRFSAFADLEVLDGQRRAVEAALAHSKEMVGQALPAGLSLPNLAEVGIAWNQLPQEAVQDLVGRLGDGSPLRELLDRIPGQATAAVGDALVSGVAQGWGPRKTADVVRRETGMGLSRALRISRTEVLRSYRVASRRQYEANPRIVKGWRRHSAKDSRVCLACLMLDGKRYQSQEDMDDHVQGRCLPGWVLASGPAPMAATARRYEGQLIGIRTASGIDLSLTPNHPVLTLGGWVAAGLLKEGDYVVCAAGSERAAATINKDDYQVPALIEQIAESFSVVASLVPTPADFHGDGVGSEVYVVRADSLLRDRVNTLLAQPFRQQSFGCGRVGLPLLAGNRNAALMLKGMGPTPGSLLSNSYSPMMLFDGSGFGQQAICSDQVTAGDACHFEPALHGPARNAETLGQSVFGLTRLVEATEVVNGDGQGRHSGRPDLFSDDSISDGFVSKQTSGLQFIRQALIRSVESASCVLRALASNVSLDRVLEVSVGHFSGHVYNLQTSAGWYIASSIPQTGVVVHNCGMVPDTISYEDLGIPVQSPPIEWERGKDWFERQSPATQQEMMGEAMYRAWRDGKFKLEQLPKRHEDPDWGPSWTVASLKDLGIDWRQLRTKEAA